MPRTSVEHGFWQWGGDGTIKDLEKALAGSATSEKEIGVRTNTESEKQLAEVLAAVSDTFHAPAKSVGRVLMESAEAIPLSVIIDIVHILADLTTIAVGGSALCAKLFERLERAAPNRRVTVFLIVRREDSNRSIRYPVGSATPNDVVAAIPADAQRKVKGDERLRLWIEPEGWMTYEEYEDWRAANPERES